MSIPTNPPPPLRFELQLLYPSKVKNFSPESCSFVGKYAFNVYRIQGQTLGWGFDFIKQSQAPG